MRGDFRELQIRGKVKGNEIDVVFRQTATPLRPGNGYVFLGSTDTFQGWFSAFPSATATGHVIIGGRRSRSMVSDTMITTTATYRSARGTGAGFGRGPRSSDTRPSPSTSRTVRDSEGGGAGALVYDKETKKELVRATTLDDMTITVGMSSRNPTSPSISRTASPRPVSEYCTGRERYDRR
jgi:hypothetical protein